MALIGIGGLYATYYGIRHFNDKTSSVKYDQN